MTKRSRARFVGTALAALLHVVGAGVLGLDLGRVADFIGGGVYALGVFGLLTTWRAEIVLHLRRVAANVEGRA